MPQYVQETLATIRRRLGYLVYREKFMYDTVVAATNSTVTLNKAKAIPAQRLSGMTLYVLDGDAAGLQSNVSQSERGTGIVTVVPALDEVPSVGSTVEIWPEGVDPEQANNFINMAILDVQTVAKVLTRQTPSISEDRKLLTVTDMSAVARLTYKLSSGERVLLRPRHQGDPLRDDGTFILDGLYLELDNALPSDAQSVTVIGYRAPAFLEDDDDVAEVRSDFLVYKAAELMAAGAAEGPGLDPEAHGSQALTWMRAADRLRPSLLVQHLSNTQAVDTFM